MTGFPAEACKNLVNTVMRSEKYFDKTMEKNHGA